mgnify:CR=1 FL=1
MVEWLAGNRIRGTSAEKPVGILTSPSVGGWVEVGRTTLGSAGDTITVSGLADKRYYMLLANVIPTTGQANGKITFNGDAGSNYSERTSRNGTTDSTQINNSNINWLGQSDTSGQYFTTANIANLSSKEKLLIGHDVGQNTAGAGSAPARAEIVGKWANTSSSISSIAINNTASSDYSIGSEVVVLGWDPADTHTTNFWEELASVDLSGGAADTISSGVFTSKKYLWIQAYTGNTGGATRASLRVGNTTIDSGSNYADRSSINGAADGTNVNHNRMSASSGAVQDKEFHNYFIINNSANEKLMTGSAVRANTAGAGNIPNTAEFAGKWANTSNQIDIVQMFNDQAGDFGTETIMKVWGSD